MVGCNDDSYAVGCDYELASDFLFSNRELGYARLVAQGFKALGGQPRDNPKTHYTLTEAVVFSLSSGLSRRDGSWLWGQGLPKGKNGRDISTACR